MSPGCLLRYLLEVAPFRDMDGLAADKVTIGITAAINTIARIIADRVSLKVSTAAFMGLAILVLRSRLVGINFNRILLGETCLRGCLTSRDKQPYLFSKSAIALERVIKLVC